jgi:hypothetical protein
MQYLLSTQPISIGTSIKPIFCTQKIIAYAVPSCFSGIILGTEGHIADGTRENPMPSIIISTIAIGVASSIGIEYIA